jgi:hypothetical protein
MGGLALGSAVVWAPLGASPASCELDGGMVENGGARSERQTCTVGVAAVPRDAAARVAHRITAVVDEVLSGKAAEAARHAGW